MLIDSHTHIYLEQFDEDREDMIGRARAAGVVQLYLPNIDIHSLDRLDSCVKEYEGFCHGMIGLHPCSVGDDAQSQIAEMQSRFESSKYVAIGEIGVDLYWDKTKKAEQIKSFEYQIDWALDLGLPIVIHSRDALDINIDIVRKKQNGQLKGIFHCFNGNADQAKEIKDFGFLIGLGGVVTYKSAKMDDVFDTLELSDFVIETDAPYLSPVPKRGKRNEPAFLPYIVQRLEDVTRYDYDQIANSSTENARSLFGADHFILD